MRLANGHLSPLAFNPGTRDRPPAWQAGDVAGGGADHPSPVQCRLVWEDTPSTPTSPSACFLAHDTDGVAPLLCLHSAHRATLTMLAGLRGPGGATATQRPALTALPLEDAPHALRGGDPSSVPPARRCVLVLEPGTGALRALAGPRHHLARLCLPGRQSGRRSVTAIADPAGCEVTIATDGGTRLRVSFHLRPSCPAVAAALAAVAEAAGHGAGLELQTTWLQALGERWSSILCGPWGNWACTGRGGAHACQCPPFRVALGCRGWRAMRVLTRIPLGTAAIPSPTQREPAGFCRRPCSSHSSRQAHPAAHKPTGPTLHRSKSPRQDRGRGAGGAVPRRPRLAGTTSRRGRRAAGPRDGASDAPTHRHPGLVPAPALPLAGPPGCRWAGPSASQPADSSASA